jgi:hypothetical protein
LVVVDEVDVVVVPTDPLGLVKANPFTATLLPQLPVRAAAITPTPRGDLIVL